MALEQVLASSKSALISSLDFAGAPPIASYIQRRNQIQVFSSGGNSYSPEGVKLLRFNVTTQGAFLDLQSMSLKATCVVGAASPVTFVGPNLGTLISEMRVYLGGTECERTQHYNRTEALLHRLVSVDKRKQLANEGWGYLAGSDDGAQTAANGTGAWTYPELAANSQTTVVYRFAGGPSGICSQKCYLPAAFIGAGVVVELLLTNTCAEVCTQAAGAYTLQDIRLLVDAVEVDPSFSTSLSKHLLGGGSLQIPVKQYQSTFFSITGPSQQLVLARSMTRCNMVLVTFDDTNTRTGVNRQCNLFSLGVANDAIKVQAQIGSYLWPDHRQDGLSEMFHRLLMCVGVANASATVNISKATYGTNSYICASDFESVPGQAHASGQSTHQSPMTLDISGLSATQADRPTGCYLLCWFEGLITVEQDGISYAI